MATFSEKLTALGNEAIKAAKEKLRTLENQTYVLPTKIVLHIYPSYDFEVHKLEVKKVVFDCDGELAFVSDLSDDEISQLLDYENGDGYCPEECYVTGNDNWDVDWNDMFTIIDLLLNLS